MVSAGAMQASLLALASITGASAFFASPGVGAIPSVRSSSASSVASTSALQTKRSWVRRQPGLSMAAEGEQETVVVVGNGMVGHKFIESLKEKDPSNKFNVVTFCEESRAAYNRMRLTEYFTNKDPDNLSMSGSYNENGDGLTEWYKTTPGVECYVGDKALKIDRDAKTVISESGREIKYDKAVLATGSYPFVPPTPGAEKKGVFVYRTIDDLENMIQYQKDHGIKAAAVIGGGLLGLEAAKAMYDLGMETHIIEYAPILMCRQIDDAGHAILGGMIEDLGLKIHCNARVTEFIGDDRVTGLTFSNEGWEDLDVGMVVVSAGIRPRDEIARASGIEVHERGGVIVDDLLRTNDEDIYAIGEVALHGGKIYGLVAPGYEMAESVAKTVIGEEQPFTGADMSTKLKLMGVDVASFGRYSGFKEEDDQVSMTWNDPFNNAYKKLFFNKAGTKLLGGILVGDASDYTTLLGLQKSDRDLPIAPGVLMAPAAEEGGGAALGIEDMPDDMQVCSCNDVDKGTIYRAVTEDGLSTVGEVKSCTKAGTGCGGCEPLVKDIFTFAMKNSGKEVSTDICEHFKHTRQELYDIVRATGVTSFDELLDGHGNGDGCEVCKPLVSNILASVTNDMIFEHDGATLQDTNDRSLANMQRGGSYSVIPRVPGGELTPDQLICMGQQVAKKYNLYTKVTGGQRIDMFGAEKHQLPEIWAELGKAGLESGHAYGKALRTVKSCVGSTWCRYGVQDAVSFAVQLENRYKGLRSPHKLKSGVSGCVRECAEAQGKDFGLVATETGYNLYVCGNGGAVARHADLLATDISAELCMTYIDRFLMFYIATADRLQRTSAWMEKLDGGIEYLKDVVINDKLGIAEQLDAQMQHVVDTYQDEWATVVNDEERRKAFRQFVNSDHTERGIPFIAMRGQSRPMDWPKDEFIPNLHEEGSKPDQVLTGESSWVRVGDVSDFPNNGGAAVLYGKSQLAVYNVARRNEWYATQNVCPHKRALVLSEGIVGSREGILKVACPLHKNNFDLNTGECLDHMEDDNMKLLTFPVKVEDGSVFLDLPPIAELDQLLATEKVMLSADCFQDSKNNIVAVEDSTLPAAA
ncbi:unnamed protein product [Pylaiella littoralis]